MKVGDVLSEISLSKIKDIVSTAEEYSSAGESYEVTVIEKNGNITQGIPETIKNGNLIITDPDDYSEYSIKISNIKEVK